MFNMLSSGLFVIVILITQRVRISLSLSTSPTTPVQHHHKKMKSLENYLKRIGVSDDAASSDVLSGKDRQALALIMEAHSRSISFENYDVVQKQTISMNPEDVERKLVENKRGGYCFEQNTLLKSALEDLGFEVVIPLLCRVRWGKPDDSLEPNTTFTHLALQVKASDGSLFLADVGFAGTNSVEPVRLDVGNEPQSLIEGQFRVTPSKHTGFQVLELLVKEEWKPLYEWRSEESAPFVDQEACNWFSCTFPKARFTSQFFCCRIVGNERHHILNNEYVIRKGHGVTSTVTKEQITDKKRLLELVDKVFGVELSETEGIDRFL